MLLNYQIRINVERECTDQESWQMYAFAILYFVDHYYFPQHSANIQSNYYYHNYPHVSSYSIIYGTTVAFFAFYVMEMIDSQSTDQYLFSYVLLYLV